MFHLLLDLLLFACCAVAPGWAIAGLALRDAAPLTVAAAGLTIALFVVPLVHFAVAILLTTHLTAALLIGDAIALLALCTAWWWWRRRRSARSPARTREVEVGPNSPDAADGFRP